MSKPYCVIKTYGGSNAGSNVFWRKTSDIYMIAASGVFKKVTEQDIKDADFGKKKTHYGFLWKRTIKIRI